MKEDFLHYIWKFKKFDFSDLKTTNGEKINIINSGQYTQLAGPDFFNAQIEIDNQKWAGNVEIHIKSSDWYLHNHHLDENYKAVIFPFTDFCNYVHQADYSFSDKKVPI